ncbi:MAG TPA: tRNA threonylcarbamoyladenosine dehydratase [Candidatus Merdivicinus intestinigallinarum]|nr:tRNA threonylcarbamoyladenosine dehydratase [Candidatus Merdivicinus intestinigallinarum]
MANWQDRQELLLGKEACQRLAAARVAVIGLGGVGGACAEGLARAGIGSLLLVDHDTVDITNLNRQLLATRQTVGKGKAEAARERVLSINPDCEAVSLPVFYGEDTAEQVFAFHPDYVVDCIDTVTAKLHLAEQCRGRGIPLLMALGTGNRLDPSAFRIGTIEDTAKTGAGCGLARVMRRELKKRGITGQKVLYSLEPAAKTVIEGGGRYAPGSLSVCPPAAGFLMASQVLREIGGF